MTEKSFNNYPLSKEILKAIKGLNFKNPTPVQEKVIPALLDKKDSIVQAATGSGKTAAFAIPVCELVDWEENKPQALIITPTRELAIQVKEDFFHIGRFKRIKPVCVYGKSSFQSQAKDLKQKTHVVVGTPGRLIDHIEKETIDLSQIKILIIDEADEMFTMGFIEQIETIISKLPRERMTILLSATMPQEVEKLCVQSMRHPISIKIENETDKGSHIHEQCYQVEEHEKMALLKDVIMTQNPDSCIIFCNTKQNVDDVNEKLNQMDIPSKKIHGGMEQEERLDVMNRFKQGRFRYLIATDVAARGIDIDAISLVINYDISREKESYVHRIGRTGRAGKAGVAITFVTQKEGRFLEQIEALTGRTLLVETRPKKEAVEACRDAFYEKIRTASQLKEEKGAKLSQDILKLHINAGKKTKMRPVDIVGTLCNIDGVTAEDIGIINVLDVSTFVEVLNGKGEQVFRALQETPIKGRLRKVSKADS